MSAEQEDPGRRFAQAALAAFAAAGRTGDREVYAAEGPSSSHMTLLRKAAAGEGVMPRPRRNTFEAIENAANWPRGTARAVWEGEAPPELPDLPPGARRIGDPGDDLVEFHVEGNFGIRAVVKGPIRDMDALQQAVSRLIAGMQIEESHREVNP